MKSPANGPSRRLLPLILTLFASALLGACSSDENPMGPSTDEPTPAPEPFMYEVQIDLSKITVLGSCESASDNPGDFDYTIEIWGRDPNDTYILQKELTGSFSGLPGDTKTVTHLEKFRVLTGKNYYVGFKATDVDPWPNTDDYVGYAQDVNKTGGQLEYDHLLKIGNSTCGLSLSYTATEIPIN